VKRIGIPGFVASSLRSRSRASFCSRARARASTGALLLLVLGFALSGRADAPDAGAAGYRPRPSTQGAPRALHVPTRAGARVLRIPIAGTIDLGLTALVRRALADDQNAVAVLLDINTLGGRVDAAIQIRDALLESKIKTIAFIHPRAISAGALISLACDFIAISTGASIGAATPIQLGEGGSAQPVEEKMVSYFRTEMRSTAEAKGRRGDIAEAMVDASVVIPGLDQADKLLTLDTAAALSTGIADFGAQSVDEVLAKLGLQQAPRRDVLENWAEALVRFLTDPVVSGLLMSLGTLGILIELYAPGHAIPGALGVLSLALFFGGHLLVHLAGLEELLLLVAGFALMMLEVFVIPGFGVAGITGIVCIFASLLLTLIGLPLSVVFSTSAWVEPLARVCAALAVTILGMLLAIRFLPGTRAGKRLVLASATLRSAGFVASDESRFAGKEGVAESDLRPVGVARFGDERVDVVTEGEYVQRGQALTVVHVEGARIVVRVVNRTSG
jgi:membrane-bound serine protease (ClpP class)